MKKPIKKSSISLSVSEFKSWMSGVEDMQEAGWVPNKVQWERIRSKIAMLSEDCVKEDVAQPVVAPVVPAQSLPVQTPNYNNLQQFGGFGNSFEPAYPTTPQFVDHSAVIDNITYSDGGSADFI